MKIALKNLSAILTEKGKTLTETETKAVKGGCGYDIRRPQSN